jgi:manganese/zinc/iron transport system permease protein
MLMCLAAALVGTVVFLRKQSLVGESLSHSAYPGVIMGILFSAYLLGENSDSLPLLILMGAFSTALLGLYFIHAMEKKLKSSTDSALCFVLSSFFGIGITLASRVQFTHTTLYKQALVFLYGQAATMTDFHIAIYAILSFVVIGGIILVYKELQTIIFDSTYAKSLGIPVETINALTFTLIALAIVVGIRSVGVVLMSAMLIAPAAAARQFTNKFGKMFVLSSFFGLFSGFLGNFLSVELTKKMSDLYPAARIILPTGPMIVVVATAICIFSLFFAPERGLVLRLFRIDLFRYRCLCENVLKTLWRFGPGTKISFEKIIEYQNISTTYLRFILWRLEKNGWIKRLDRGAIQMTRDGMAWGANIVRLHRLWEVYLSDYLGVGAERVHANAEEMEHIITPELERELTILLKDPKKDPHQQPIPEKGYDEQLL